jgi:hypothetical protein
VAEPSLTVRLAGAGDGVTLAALRREWTEEYARGSIDDDGSIPFYARAGFRPTTSLLILDPVDNEGGARA